VVAVADSDPTMVEGRNNVALTVFRVDNGAFRIAATNVTATTINKMVVRWWALSA
jgi:hypothetical protein